jgi:hypothetical protein
MSRAEFYDMPVGEFWEAVNAYYENEESERRHIGELVRGAALRLWNIQLKKGDQIRDPSKFWPMPWDDVVAEGDEAVRELESLSDEERDARAAAFLKNIGWMTNDGRE